MKTILRIMMNDFLIIAKHLETAGHNESFVYALFCKLKTPTTEILLCRQILLPEKTELKNQSPVSVEPGKVYQATVYAIAYQNKLSLIDFHSHPFSAQARFSPVDNHHGKKNARYITRRFPEKCMMAMVVLGRGNDNFQAQIWDKKHGRFKPIHRIEILGCPTTILTDDKKTLPTATDEVYARHKIIPGWKQGQIEELKVFECGLGGNGALVFESLIALGIGRSGWIKAIDPDIIEESNIPRIPYASLKDVGKSKTEIAKRYAKKKDPFLNVECFSKSIEDEEIRNEIKKANIVFGAVDNDPARLTLNSLCARYMIPYIDLGSEIIPSGKSYEAIGQVQVFVPGQNGCLLCSGIIDPSRAALESMNEAQREEHARVGYVTGTSASPTPSVLHLNGVVSHLAISQFLRLIFDDGFSGKDLCHYNRQTASILTASVSSADDCPVCGVNGILGLGDDEEVCDLEELKELKDESAFVGF